jgi:hypothetical protein
MSEQNFPLGGGVGVAEPEPTVEETPAGGSRGVLLAVLGLAVAVVIGLAAYFLLFSGGSEEVASGPVTSPAPSASTAPSTAPSASAPAPAAVPPTFDENVGTDPFKAQVVAPAPEPSGAAAGTAASTGTTSGTVVQLQLLSVADDSSVLDAQVDGTPYKGLAVGSSFATYFKVYGIFDGRCAGFLFGDQTVALCEGDTANLSK